VNQSKRGEDQRASLQQQRRQNEDKDLEREEWRDAMLRKILRNTVLLGYKLDVLAMEEELDIMWIEKLRAELANNTTVSQGAVVAVNTLADKVQELINNGAEPAELQEFVDTLRANDAAVAKAIADRTAAQGEPAPTPVEPQVEPEPTPEEPDSA